MKDVSGDGFVASRMALRFDAQQSKAVVFDGIVDYVYSAPVQGRLKSQGDGKYRIMDRVNDIPASPRPVDINYRLDVDTQKKSVSLRGLLPGYENSIIGRGQCVEQEWHVKK